MIADAGFLPQPIHIIAAIPFWGSVADSSIMDISLAEKVAVSEGSIGSKNAFEDGLGLTTVNTITVTDNAAEKKLVRKCDLRVVPILTLLYSLAFVDRINIGNAR